MGRVLSLYLALIVWGISTPSLAQDGDSAESAPESMAPDTSTAIRGVETLEGITVSGERFDRSLEDTASSVVVSTEEHLQQRPGTDSVDSVLELVPNISVADGSGTTIRGQDTNGVLQGADGFLGGSRPRATIQVDGRPLNFNQFVYGDTELWDVKQVEVFRGPQTTTQGPNSIAGAIFVETNDPTFHKEAAARGIIASYDTQGASAMVSGPIVKDQLAARVSFDYRTHETFLNFVNPDPYVGEDRRKEESVVGRAKLLFEPEHLPGLSSKLTVSIDQFQGSQVEIAHEDAELGLNFEDRTNTFDNNLALWEIDSRSVIHDLEYDFVSGVSASNTFVYSDIKVNRLSGEGQGPADIDGDDLVNETIVSFESEDSPFSGLIGNYLRVTEDEERIDLSAFLGLGDFNDKKFSNGVFTELTYAATEKLDLTAGIRYQRDSQKRSGSLGPFMVDFDKTYEAFLPKFVIAYQFTDTFRAGVMAQKGYNPGGTTVSFASGAQDFFDEEEVWNYELFARTSWLDERVKANANIFYSDYTDLQRGVTTEQNGQFVTELDNAEDAYAYGAELELAVKPLHNLQLFGSLGVLETKLQRYSISVQPVAGNEFALAPELTAAARVQYQPIEGLDFSLQGRYSDGYFSNDLNDPLTEIESYFITDAQISYTYKNVRVFVYGTNLANEFYVNRIFFSSAQVGDPREIGAGLEIRM